jgi:multidrug resistance efflux pump
MNGCSQSKIRSAKAELAMAKFHLSATDIKRHFQELLTEYLKIRKSN